MKTLPKIDLKQLLAPVYEKIGKRLSKGEMLLLLLEKLITQNWGEDRGFKRIDYRPRGINGEVKRILVIQTSSIGDVVYTTPAIRGLRERFKDASITVLVTEATRELLTKNPNVDEVIAFPWELYRRRILEGKESLHTLIKDVYGNIRSLGNKRFDLLVNLSVTPLSGFLTRLIGARDIYGLCVDETGSPLLYGGIWVLYTFYIKANRVMDDLNRLDLMELHLRMADVNPSIRRLEIYIDPKVEEMVALTLKKMGINEGDLVIGLNPGAGYRARCWGWERFASLGDRLNKTYNARIIIFGGKREEAMVSDMVKKMRSSPINLAGKTSLEELSGYLKLCDHLITNDTGPMHIAAAMGTKVIGICGPTLVGPLGEGHLLIRADLPCVGCGTTSTCTKGDCMEAIDVEDVMSIFRYQRGETKEIPNLPGINVYSTKEGRPTRLFFYRPIKRDPMEVEKEVLRLLYLNLWIRENNRLGFLYEDEISWDEMIGELKMDFEMDDIEAGIDRVIRRAKKMDDTIVRLLTLYDLIYEDPLSLQRAKADALHYMVNFLEILRRS